MVKKKKYKIAIEESVVGEFLIEASDTEEAMEIAEEKYKSGEIVLYTGEVHHKQMAITSPESETTEWVEF